MSYIQLNKKETTMLKKKQTRPKTIGQRSRANLAQVRERVYDRDGHTCIVAGSRWEWLYPCGGELSLQHSVPRGMGGSAKYDDVDFLRTMCVVHNVMETSNAQFAQACQRNGWSVRRGIADQFGIKVIPVWYADGWHLLQGGERIRISKNTAEAIWSDMGMTFDAEGDFI